MAVRDAGHAAVGAALPKARDFIPIGRPVPAIRQAPSARPTVPARAESQDSELRVPDFLIRREEQETSPSHEPPSPPATFEELPLRRAQALGVGEVSPYHIIWMVPLLASVTWLLVERVDVLSSLMIGTGLSWGTFIIFAMLSGATREMLPCLRTTTVLQVALTALVVSEEWVSVSNPTVGPLQWLTSIATAMMAGGMAVLERWPGGSRR